MKIGITVVRCGYHHTLDVISLIAISRYTSNQTSTLNWTADPITICQNGGAGAIELGGDWVLMNAFSPSVEMSQMNRCCKYNDR